MAIHLGRRSYGNVAFSRTAPPDAFDVADWALGQGSNFTLDIFIFNLPDFNGFPITQLEYRLNGGAAIPLNSTALGVYNISGLDEDVAYDVEIRAVNARGAGDWSDVKTETTAGFSPLTLFSNGEQGVWYDPSDLTTMFQETTGRNNLTAAGQSVALLLDKSKGLVLGPELVTNGTFDTDTSGWLAQNNVLLTWENGEARCQNINNTGSGTGVFQNIPVIAGVTYEIRLKTRSPTGGNCRLLGFNAVNGLVVEIGSSEKVTVARFRAVSTGNGTFMAANSTGNALWFFDDFSVRELPGNHATQSITAARPILARVPEGGRRNLLQRTEEFDNAYWSKFGSTVSANTEVAPNGTITADRATESTSDSSHNIVSQSVAFVSGQSYTFSCYLKKGEGITAPDWVQILFGTAAFGSSQYANFNLTTITTGAVVGGAAAIIDAGDGWRRISFTATASATASAAVAAIQFTNNNNTLGRAPTYIGAVTSDVLIWGAQLEIGSTATAYQRVGSTFDVTEAGKRDLWYLEFDGIDDGLVTNSINFTATDKMTALTGITKLASVGTAGMVVELRDGAIQDRFFNIGAPGNTTQYFFQSRGSGGSIGTASTTDGAYAAPHAAVLAGIGDISGNSAILRVSGTQVASSATVQGTGGYANAALYVGRRGGSTLAFNGQLYSLIVRGAETPTATIQQAEAWIAARTGVTL